MDPTILSNRVAERYTRYLETTFYFKDPGLRKSFRAALRSGQLAKGPYLEATPTFKRGRSIQDLYQELLGDLSDDRFLRGVGPNRPLYLHQEQAIRKVCAEQCNIVVATGTGSGKTEAFLYPILLHLYKEFRAGQLGPGVRALILYPMNALANDQRERLGVISQSLDEAGSPFNFTFGQYTGETPEDGSDMRRHAGDRIANRLPGELVLRKEMRDTPPHILLTNYSMLEYLLIRPSDSPLFDNGQARWWQFLVLDEAHQYRGSRGIEMGMLLRRLKQRLREGGRNGPFRCIATSATIVGSPEDKAAVASFASELFDEKFEEQHIILGDTETVPDPGPTALSSEDYAVLWSALESDSASDLQGIADRLGIRLPQGLPVPEIVGALLQGDRRAAHIRRILTKAPKAFSELARELFPNASQEAAEGNLAEFVRVLVRAKDPDSRGPLLSARYHLFLRSLEGAFVVYAPEPRVFLERRGGDKHGAAFEVALCRECGQHYLVGRIRNGVLCEAVRDPGHADFGATFFRPVSQERPEAAEENNSDDPANTEIFRLCVVCGTIARCRSDEKELSCGHSHFILVERQEGSEEKEDQIPRCSACGYRAPDPVREVIHGTDGPHAVIATTLCQNLPAERRKVLAFADGRQQAAFFAWYLEESYRDIQDRHLILEAVEKAETEPGEGLSLRELAIGLRDVYRKHKILPPTAGSLEQVLKAWRVIYREFLTDEPRISLEGVGLLRWWVNWPDVLTVPALLLSPPWSMCESVARDLMFLLLDHMRRERAVELKTPENVPLAWSDLSLRAPQSQVRVGAPRRSKVRSWDGRNGRRAEFLTRLLMRKGVGENEASEKAVETLRVIWDAFRQADESGPPEFPLLVRVRDARRVNPDWWRTSAVSDGDILYQCDTCARLQPVSVGGVCSRYRCPGTLMPMRMADAEENHYRVLYKDVLPGVLRVEEHTAQIDKEKARDFQRSFKRGDIHVLSCSTTFELGVDLGDLDTVFLRNVPPEAFNYAQRVGRAGRRSGFPGFAVTFCRRVPHDLYHFVDPTSRILARTIRPPTVALINEKIITRHMAAVALSCFFRSNPGRFKGVRSMFGDLQAPSGTKDLLAFLQRHRHTIERSLEEIVPSGMRKAVGLGDAQWIDRIAGTESRLAAGETEVCSDFTRVKELQADSALREDFCTAQWAKRRSETIANEDALSFLSRKAIIPKYGFPVDVVELDCHRVQGSSGALDVALQRDLSIAIAEFAPTSKLVANKKEWCSYGLKKVAGKEWPRKFYRRCSEHNSFVSWSRGETPPQKSCCPSAVGGKYVVPQFGFVTDRQKPKPPTGRSSRVFTTRPYFLGLVGGDPGSIQFGGVILTKACPGSMVVLCEGRKGVGFYICGTCGAGFRERKSRHKSPYGEACSGTLERVSLGHEFETDVLQLQFSALPPAVGNLPDLWFAYSLAYALVEGSAEALEVPSSDLSTTVAHGGNAGIPPIVLYDNVPGGAGLVARLEDRHTFRICIEAALARVSGDCGCGENESCYGCLRSYRNQYAHQHLARGPVKQYLESLLLGME